MTFLRFFLVTALAVSTAQAEVFEGIVSVSGKKQSCANLILRQETRDIVLVPVSVAVAKDLELLEDGDFLSITGELLDAGHAEVTHLEFTGVLKLLGRWTDDFNRRMIDFENFHSLRRTDAPGSVVHLAYTLVPEAKDRWTIFLSNNDGVQLGALSYSPRGFSELLLTLFDDAGRVRERLHLYPFRSSISK